MTEVVGMNGMRDDLTGKPSGEKGQGLVEYALILAFVVALSMVLLAVRPELRESIAAVFGRMAELLGFS